MHYIPKKMGKLTIATELNNKLVNKIIKDKKTCVFVSPHLDDAVLSAGDLIQYLAKKTKVVVITVFTEASRKPYTFFTKRFVSLCGYRNTDEFFSKRKQEDLNIFNDLSIKYHHLGFIDAAWRKKENPGYLTRLIGRLIPEFLHIYPIYRVNIQSNRIARADKNIINAIVAKLSEIVNSEEDYYIFCPLAVNTHIDHVITREAVRRNFKNATFWTDFPYSQFRNVRPNLDHKDLKEVLGWENDTATKRNMIMAYESQVNLLFPGGNIELKPEFYYEER
mgnify:CR=1 FL=1